MESVEDKLRELCLEPIHKAAYADWSCISYMTQRLLTDFGYAIQQFPCAPGKNSADLRLAVDVGWLVASQRPQAAVIFSSDRDFIPVLSRLRQFGIEVFAFLTDPRQAYAEPRALWKLATDNNVSFVGQKTQAAQVDAKDLDAYFEEYKKKLLASVAKVYKIRGKPPTTGQACSYVKMSSKPLGKLKQIVERIPELTYDEQSKCICFTDPGETP